MNQEQILQVFREAGAIITNDHFVYTSGKHGSAYVNKDAIYPDTEKVMTLCAAIAQQFGHYEPPVQVVIGPALGGLILSWGVAYYLTIMGNRTVWSVYAEKSEDGEAFIIKRGYDKIISHKNVLVVEDVLTTGGSVKKVVEVTRTVGGNVIGLAALCNRGGVTPEQVGLEINPGKSLPRFFTLMDVKLDAWDEKDCPLCVQGIPINTDVGKGREYLAGRGR